MTGWPTLALGEICTIVGGATPPKNQASFYNGDILWATVRDMNVDVITDTEHKITQTAVDSCSTNIIPANNVVIASRVGLGKACLTSMPTAINQDLRGVLPKSLERLSVQYLYRWFQSVSEQIIAAGRGATVQGVTLPFLKSLQIPLPPLPEQQRIVGILDQAFEGIATTKANAERNLTNAKELYANAFNDLLALRCQDVPMAPLDTIADFKNGLNFSRSSKGEVIKIVGVADFKNNFWTPDELDEVQIEGSLSEAYELRDNDILVVRSNGNKELIGRCILAQGVKGKTSHSGFTIRVRPHSDGVDAEYLTHFMKSSAVRKSLVASGDGANISSLNQKALSSIIVPIPPVSAQRDIVNDLSILGEKIGQMTAIMNQKSSAIDDLRQSILHQAFSGNL